MEHEQCTRRFFDAWFDPAVEPVTPEHRLLQALWTVADEDERRGLVRTFLRARSGDLDP